LPGLVRREVAASVPRHGQALQERPGRACGRHGGHWGPCGCWSQWGRRDHRSDRTSAANHGRLLGWQSAAAHGPWRCYASTSFCAGARRSALPVCRSLASLRAERRQASNWQWTPRQRPPSGAESRVSLICCLPNARSEQPIGDRRATRPTLPATRDRRARGDPSVVSAAQPAPRPGGRGSRCRLTIRAATLR
jgi:hypothetical protein